VVLGINTDGRKDILGIWIGQHESAKFWAGVLNDLKSRGVKVAYKVAGCKSIQNHPASKRSSESDF